MLKGTLRNTMVRGLISALFLCAALGAVGQTGSIKFDTLTGPTGGSVRDLQTNSSLDLFALVSERLFRSTNNGDDWEEITPVLGNDGLVAASVDKFDKIYLLGTSKIWTSTDNGDTWTAPITPTGTYQPTGKLLKSPTSGFLFCEGNLRDLLRSTNDGVSWSKVYDGSSDELRDFTIGNTGSIFLGTNGGGNLHKSENEGNSFVTDSDPSLTNPGSGTVSNLEVNKDNGRIYALYSNSPDGIFVTEDDGTSWARVTTQPNSLTFPSGQNDFHDLIPSQNSDRVFVRDGQDMYFSDNASSSAATWSQLANYDPGNNFVSSSIATNSSNVYVGLGNDGVYASTTGGSNWDFRNDNIFYDRSRSFVRANNGNLLVVNGGSAISISEDDGQSWTREVVCTSCNVGSLIKKQNGDILAIGNETFLSTAANGGAVGSWTDIGGPPGFTFIDRASSFDGEDIWGFENETVLYHSVNGGVSFTAPVITGLPGPLRVFRVAVDDSNNLFLWTDTGEIYKVLDGTTVGTPITNTGLSNLRGLKSLNGIIYVFGRDNSSNSDAYAKSTDGGASWTRQDIEDSNEVAPAATDVLFLVKQTGGDQADIKYSVDAGVTWKVVFSGTYHDSEIAGAALDASGFGYLVVQKAATRKSQSVMLRPSKPTSLTNIGLSDEVAYFEWDYSGSQVEYFKIERKLAASSTYDSVSFAGSSDLYGFDRSMLKNTNYDFRIVAVNDAGTAASDPISVLSKDECSMTIPDNRSWTGTVAGETPNTTIGIRKFNSKSFRITDVAANALSTVTGGGEIEGIFYENCGEPFIEPTNDLFPDGNGTLTPNTIVLNFQSNKAEYTPESKQIMLVLNPNDPTPGKPLSPSAYVFDNSTIQIEWQADFYQLQYAIERSTTAGTGFTVVNTVNYPTLSYKDTGPFTVGTTYFYRIKALNANSIPQQESMYSDEISVEFKTPIFVLANTVVNATAASVPSVAWADFDNDGFEDLVMPVFNSLSTPISGPLLFKNMGGTDFQLQNGGFQNFQNNISPIIGDVNNDGFLDFFVVGSGFGEIILPNRNSLYINDGDFTFTEQTSSVVKNIAEGQSTFSSGFTDFNNDGLLDIFIPFQDGAGQKLYRAVAGSDFAEVTGDPLVTEVFSKEMSIWGDYDNDGRQDVFILGGNDSEPNRLFRNVGGGSFAKVVDPALESILSDNLFSCNWVDYNNDQFLDLFIADQQGKNYLFKNDGDGTFTQLSVTPGSPTEDSTNGSTGTTWGDIDNDGDLDLLVGTAGNSNLLYLNDGGDNFTKVTSEMITGYKNAFTVGLAFGDYNNDGALDVVIGELNSPQGETFTLRDDPLIRLFRNQGNSNNWIKIKLEGAVSNRAAIGARVKIVAGGKTQIREISSYTGFAGTNSLIAHFGLGSETSISSIEVRFPNGIQKTLTDIPSNQMLTISEDSDGPQVAAFTPKNRDKGFGSEEISINANDAVSVAGVDIVYRPIGGKEFVTDAMSRVGVTNEWKISVQEGWYDDMGLEFYFEAADPFGNKTRSPASTNHYSYLNYKETNAPKFPTTSLVFGGTESTWNIVSIPFDLGTSATVTSVLDELGAFDNTQWRLLTYQNQTAWAEFPSSFSSFERGKGYFLNVKTPPSAGITIADEQLAPQNNQADPFSMELRQGWNQIGNPYLVPINWADIKAFNSAVTGVGDLKIYNSNGRTYGDGTVLNAYQGGFVFADEAVADFKISFTGQTTGGRKRTAGRIASTELDNENWRTMFTLNQSDVTFTMGGVGMSPDAQISYDGFDDVTVPRLNDFLEMNFHHPEHHAKRFSRDVVPSQDEYVWEFTVDSNLKGIATLSWDSEAFGDNEKELYLFDIASQKPVNMRTVSAYAFDANSSDKFRVYFGENLLAKIQPEKIILGNAYPNPARGITTIPFTLPESQGTYQVQLVVYDMMGRKVRVLRTGSLPAGFYESQWDTSKDQIVNGLYTYRLVVAGDDKNEVLSRKIILNK